MTEALELNVAAQPERIKLTRMTRRLRQRHASADPAGFKEPLQTDWRRFDK